MRKQYEDLSRELKESIAEITMKLNRTAFPSDQNILKVPILKPFTAKAFDECPPVGKVEFYTARFVRAKQVSEHRGRHVFDSLEG